jgi:ABC-type multidrug transport system ATPase subunit
LRDKITKPFPTLKENMIVLKAENISFSTKNRKAKILNIKSLHLKEGSCILVQGKNGAGKSSLLSVLGGFLAPDSGEIEWKGKRIQALKDRLVPGFEGIELVKQDPDLNPFLTVSDQLIKGTRHLKESEAMSLVKKAVSICHLKPLLTQKTGSLSGGEKRRLSIALAIIKNCALLLLDEPFAELDAENKKLFLDLILSLKNNSNITICLVTHHGEDALWLANEVWTMEKGKILERIKRANGCFTPFHFQSAVLLGIKNVFKTSDFPNVDTLKSGNWIQILPESINTKGSGIPLGEACLLTQFQKENKWHCIWKLDSLLIESVSLTMTESNNKVQILYLLEENDNDNKY